MRCFYYLEAIIWFSPWCFIWVDLAHAYNMFDSYKVTINLYNHLVFWLFKPFYASLNDALSLCMIMAVIALLVGHSSLLLALVLYWVWALLVHPTPKNQVVSMCPPYIPISNLLFQNTFDLLLSILQIKLFFWCYAKIGQ
jgi:hypothetical protein